MTKLFEERKFNIPKLDGISEKTIETHLKLYGGYVQNTNSLLAKLDEYSTKREVYGYAMDEIQRRFAFEFDGMRNHEYYFSHLEGGRHDLSTESPLKKVIEAEWEQFDKWLERFKALALTRGVGWAVLYYDPLKHRALNAWVGEHELGHLVGLSPLLVLDMWEHAFFNDYTPVEKKKYVEAFFGNLNWESAEKNLSNARTK